MNRAIKFVAPFCGTYEAGFRTNNTGNGIPLVEIVARAIATGDEVPRKVGVTLFEVGLSVTAAAAHVFGLYRSTVVGQGTAPQTVVPEGTHEDPSAQGSPCSRIYKNWSVIPTLGTGAIRKGVLKNEGDTLRWEWPEDDPLMMGSDTNDNMSSLVLLSETALAINANDFTVNVRLKEFKGVLGYL